MVIIEKSKDGAHKRSVSTKLPRETHGVNLMLVMQRLFTVIAEVEFDETCTLMWSIFVTLDVARSPVGVAA